MKRLIRYKWIYILYLLFVQFPIISQAQYRFTNTTLTDLDLGNNYSSCLNTGDKALTFNVTGIPTTLSSSLTLAAIDITFDANCGNNFNALNLVIKAPEPAPNGTCMLIYEGSLSTATYSTAQSGRYVSLSIRDGSCLNDAKIVNGSTSTILGIPITIPNVPNKAVTGNYGVFKAPGATSIASVFNGINPNGTWTIYALENGNAPCISSASIVFAGSNVQDQTAAGENCSTAIEWAGQPICAQTTSKTGSSEMPGYMGASSGCTSAGTNFATTIGGQSCEWNAANNNDVWIKFTPTTGGQVCLGISGLDKELQSIVVTDANADNDNNPCTQNNTKDIPNCKDNSWLIASCPRNAIYPYTSGSTFNQQHCFTAAAGKTYYLVVDGNGGQQTTFYVSGFSGPLPAILPLAPDPFISGVRKPVASDVALNGTLLKTNLDNKNYVQEISIFDALGRLHYVTKFNVTGNSQLDLSSHMKPGFNVVKVTVSGKTVSNYTFKVIR